MAQAPDSPDYMESGAYCSVGLTVLFSALATFKHYRPKNILEAFRGDCGASLFMMALLIGVASTTILAAVGYSEPDVVALLLGI